MKTDDDDDDLDSKQNYKPKCLHDSYRIVQNWLVTGPLPSRLDLWDEELSLLPISSVTLAIAMTVLRNFLAEWRGRGGGRKEGGGSI